MSVELDGANNVVKTDTVSEVTSANGVTIDGLSIKDSKLVTANSVIEANMSANSVDSDSYVDGSIDTAHIADLNVTEGKIAADAITAAKIADNAVVTAGINADAITAAKIADNAVVTAGINADAVTGAEIADDAINSEHYTDGSRDTAHLADGQVTIGKLATAVLTGATDIGAAIVDADLFLIDDGAGGTLRKTAASRLKTFIGGGITHADQWRLNTNVTGDVDPITDVEQTDTDGFGGLGTAMSVSSGIFTFPVTGVWLIEFTAMYYHNAYSAFNSALLYTTTNNSSYGIASYGSQFIDTTGANSFASATSSFMFDVTNVTTHKVRFATDVANNSVTTNGTSGANQTFMTFIRLGDT